ncbi:MAG: MBL fold metallo-hydrolase [Caldilineaceae bacterium]|nr:MBL fold metallo-hydrolase [Caldilineaceae bacterium]
MDITWHGANCVSFKERTTMVLYDPWEPVPALTPPNKADQIALFDQSDQTQPALVTELQPTALQPDFNSQLVVSSRPVMETDGLDSLPGHPRVVASPGEYEVRGTYVQSFRVAPKPTDQAAADFSQLRMAHHMDFGTVRITHLAMPGAVFRPRDQQLVGALVDNRTDILILPIGSGADKDMAWVMDTCRRLEPSYCIPVDWQEPDLEEVSQALRTLGTINSEPQRRFRTARGSKAADNLGGMTTVILAETPVSRR